VTRFRIDHPRRTDIHAEAGVDHAVGPFFIDPYREDRDRPIKTLDFFTAGRPVTLQDCFDFLISEGFFRRDDLEAALVWMQDAESVRPSVMRVVEIIERLKSGE
jgi:hypothetical protein